MQEKSADLGNNFPDEVFEFGEGQDLDKEQLNEINKILGLGREEARNLVEGEMCRRSFKYFMHTFWDEIYDDPLEWNEHLDIICDEITNIAHRVGNGQRRKKDLIINVPPGTTKTTTISIMFPAWCWTKWPWMRFITGSYGADLSLESAEYCRDIIRSNKFKKLFPELQIKRDKDTKSNFKIQEHKFSRDGKYLGLRNRGNRFSTSVGGVVTGFHGHINILDDPNKPEGAKSEARLKDTNYWVDKTFSSRKANKKTTTMIVIQQRIAENDVTGYLLRKRGDRIKHICLPGEIRTPKYKENVKPKELVKIYDDGLLDKERMPQFVLEDMRAELGELGYAGQVGQLPTPPEGDMFKVDNFNILPNMVDSRKISRVIRYWDKAGTSKREARKKGRKPAYTAGVKMARLKNGQYVIMDVIRGQWSADVREQIIKNTARADGHKVKIWIEQEPGSGGKESAQATIRNLAGYVCKAECPRGDKIYRADPYSVQVNNGNVFIVKGDWNQEFIDEHRHFPNGRYKDQVDATAAAFNKLAKERQAGPI